MTYHEMFDAAHAAGSASFDYYSKLFAAIPDTNSLEIRGEELTVVQQALFARGCEDNYDQLVIKIAFDCGWSDAEVAE